ncbi:uncharacterized protein LOC141640599 [Silene latifolia]|uniref:uncharacterized protein LOC141640599 n=1 Tax=Silene latifolia TaxID=37657 RepID=UPI003D775FD9
MSRVKQLNKEELDVFEEVIKAVEQKTEKFIFVYGHGGTRKTFLYGTISERLRAEGKIVLNVASSGITALLVPGGRITHSRFDIPIELFEESTCNVKQNSQLADPLRQTSLIIWDEAPMDHMHVFEAVDRTMRDILSYKNPDAATKLFGGVAVVLGGDFRQVLPIVQKGGRQDIVRASINRSYIWKSCTVFLLRTSMRVRNTDSSEENKRFNEWLLAMGDGTLKAKREGEEDEATWIHIPPEYLHRGGPVEVKDVVNEIYPQFPLNSQDDDYLRARAILTPLNETADIVNNYMTNLIPGKYDIYKSCDEICASSMDSDEQFTAYPTEYLNNLHLQGLPNHELKLKRGMPVILLRNINLSQGLCNGTRLKNNSGAAETGILQSDMYIMSILVMTMNLPVVFVPVQVACLFKNSVFLKMADKRKEYRISFCALLSDAVKVLGWPEPIYSPADVQLNQANLVLRRALGPAACFFKGEKKGTMLESEEDAAEQAVDYLV